MESTFGDTLRRLRSEAGLTQEALAERAHLSSRAISDLERGVNRYPYRATVQSLVEALGLQPSQAEALRTAAQRRTRRFAEPARPRPPLPLAPTPMLGREHEVAHILHLVRWEGLRLITLTGVGGVGKTRLAQEIARELEKDFADACAFVPLAGVADATLVPSAVAAALGVQPSGRATAEDALLGLLRDQELFLVLDNFEHVLEAGNLVSRLLAGCARLKVLVTSREPLRIRGEQLMDISPLPVPNRSPPLEELRRMPSVSLLVQRARAVRPDFELSDDMGSVAEICRRLDGIPLALELAAAQLKYQSAQALVERLSHRLEVLGRGPRDLPARLQTMRAAIEWSYDLLDPQERAVFRCLSAFAGGGEVYGVTAVGAALTMARDTILSVLTALADKSLLKLQPAEGCPRFWMLETVREFAGEQLKASDDEPKVRAAHADYHLRLAEEAYPELTRGRSDWWMGRLAEELDNLRAALRWYAGTADRVRGMQLAGALWRLWLTKGLVWEGSRWLDDMLDESSGGTAEVRTRARALFASGVLAYIQNDWRRAEARYDDAHRLLRRVSDEKGLGDVLNALGLLATDQNQYRRAEEFLQEALDLARKGHSPFAVARALENLGVVAHLHGDLYRADSLYDESLEVLREIGDPVGTTVTTSASLSHLLCLQGKYERARQLDLACLESARDTDQWSAADALDSLGDIAKAQGDVDAAEAYYQESLARFEAIRAQGAVALVLVHLADLYRARRNYDRACSLASRSLALQEQTTVNDRVAFYAYLCLADVDRAQERADSACARYRVSLELTSRIEYVVGVAECLEHVGWQWERLLPEEAVTILAAAEGLRRRMGMALAPIDKRDHESALEALRRRLGPVMFDDAWGRGEPMQWVEAASFALETLPAPTTDGAVR